MAEDAHVDGTVLFREVAPLGFDRSYVTFVRELRRLALRPRCEACRTGGHGVTTVIAHEPGEEVQWDWLELTQTPWGEPAHVLVGVLAFSGKARAVICEGESFPHLAEAIDGVLRRLGGTTRAWRTDRMATVVAPGTDRITGQFAQLAKHYGVQVGCVRHAALSDRPPFAGPVWTPLQPNRDHATGDHANRARAGNTVAKI